MNNHILYKVSRKTQCLFSSHEPILITHTVFKDGCQKRRILVREQFHPLEDEKCNQSIHDINNEQHGLSVEHSNRGLSSAAHSLSCHESSLPVSLETTWVGQITPTCPALVTILRQYPLGISMECSRVCLLFEVRERSIYMMSTRKL